MRTRLLAGLAVVVVAGCGGETDEKPSAKPTAARSAATPANTMAAADWSKQVEEICSANATVAEQDVLDIKKDAEAQGLSQEEFVAKVLDHSVDLTEPLIERVEAMPAPKGREAQAQQFVAAMKDTLPAVRDTADALRDHDDAAAKKATQAMAKAAVDARAAARELEIQECIPRSSTG